MDDHECPSPIRTIKGKIVIPSCSVFPNRSNEIDLGSCNFLNTDIELDPSIKFSIKPMLFAGNCHRAREGWYSFKGFFDSVDEAKQFVEKNLECYMWAHIVEDGNITWKFEYDDWNDGSMQWKEVKNERQERLER